MLISIQLTGCSAMSMLSALTPSKPAVSVDAQIGEEANKQVILGNQSKTTIDADNVSGDLNQVSTDIVTGFTGDLQAGSFTVNNMPTMEVMAWIAVLIFLIGVLCPTPSTMIRWLVNQVRQIVNIIKPKKE